MVYDELRKLAAAKLAKVSSGQSLQPTLLVHEAYLRLVKRTKLRVRGGRVHLPCEGAGSGCVCPRFVLFL